MRSCPTTTVATTPMHSRPATAPLQYGYKKRGVHHKLLFFRVTDGARTHDIWNHNPTLCQLSYSHHLRSAYLVVQTFSFSLQTVNVNLQTALKVGCFVLVNNVLLGEFVQHSSYFGEKFLSSSFVGGATERFHSVTGCSVVILIRNTTSLCLANTFFGRLVICHNYLFFKFFISLAAHSRVELLFQE